MVRAQFTSCTLCHEDTTGRKREKEAGESRFRRSAAYGNTEMVTRDGRAAERNTWCEAF